MINIVDKAKNFAAWAHGRENHSRKYTLERYIVHPAEVAGIVAEIGGDDNMVAAAWLHDVLEDTRVTRDDLLEIFSADVVELVEWLTDVSKPSDGNRAIRKGIDRIHTANAPSRAKTIKLADIINNSISIIKHDPNFAKVFISEKSALLKVLTDGNSKLFGIVFETVEDFIESKKTT